MFNDLKSGVINAPLFYFGQGLCSSFMKLNMKPR